jgi:hypothetical protein
MLKALAGKKTYILANATIAYAVCGWLTGNMDFTTAWALAAPVLAAAFVRHGIKTETAK